MGQKISEKQMKEEIRSVVRQNIKEVTTNDWHYKAIMSIWDKGGSFTRKKIGAVLCNDPKADRRDVENAIRNSGYDEVTDVTDRLRIEGIITEKQFKGLDGIPANKSLKDISDEQKIKILQSVGNIIDFIVPKGHKRNFWQVISTGKIAKQNLSNGTVYFLTGKIIPSPSYSSIKELLANVKWDSMEERRRFNESINEGEDNIPGGLAKGMTLNDIAEKHGVSVDMLVAEFKKGIQTEMEHTTDREMAKEITMDHLFEDPQYYTKLSSVEEYVDDKGVEHVAAALPQTEEEPIKEEESEETLRGLKEMAMGDLERIADYAKMILERMGSGQELDSWMYSQITLAVDQLNSVHDTMDGNDGIKESINELTYSERQIKDGNPNNVFYAFYKGQFEAIYSAMGPRGLFDMYWDKFKVRRPAGSKFKLNPEFVIVPKKEYDNSTSNHYAKLKPYVDKFWDKLQNESVVKENILNEDLDALGLLIPALGALIGGGLAQLYPYFTGRPNIYTNIKDWWNSKKDNSEMNKIANRIKNDPDVQEFLKKKNKSGWKEMLKKKLTGSELNYLNKIYRSRFNNESVNEGTEPEVITQIKTIAKNHQHDVIVDPKSGKKMRVDAFSASAIATVYDALSSSSKEKFLASGLLGMQQMAMKLLKR